MIKTVKVMLLPNNKQKNKINEIKRLKKKQHRLQCRISKKYLINKEGDSYCKTSNIIKSEKALIKLNHCLTGIRHNYLHQVTSEIIKRKPSFIVLEDLNVTGMKHKGLYCFITFYKFSVTEYNEYQSMLYRNTAYRHSNR